MLVVWTHLKLVMPHGAGNARQPMA